MDVSTWSASWRITLQKTEIAVLSPVFAVKHSCNFRDTFVILLWNTASQANDSSDAAMNRISASQSSVAVPHPLATAQFLRRLEHYAHRHLGDEASAQDTVQATLEVLLRAKTEFRGESAYSTYAIGILRHKIGDALRERKRFVQMRQDDEGNDQAGVTNTAPDHGFSSGDFTGPEDHAHTVRLGQAIQIGLQSLSPRGRQVFLMRERLGLGSAEISEQLGLTLSNTWVLLCRAKRQLRESLTGQGYGIDKAGACGA